MSYARFGSDSDVYIFAMAIKKEGAIVCCECPFMKETDRNWPQFKGPATMIRHLNKHIKVGHKVPEHTFERLREEIKNGEWR